MNTDDARVDRILADARMAAAERDADRLIANIRHAAIESGEGPWNHAYVSNSAGRCVTCGWYGSYIHTAPTAR